MARRRKWFRSRYSPDRGWLVGFASQQFANEGTPFENRLISLFDFADIDAEALTGRIEQDKSDWFVKRVIVDVYAAVAFENTAPTDTARIWQLGLGVMGNADAEVYESRNDGVISPETYNNFARLFQTWTRPVYASALIPYTAEFAVATPGSSGGNPASYGVTSTPWGPSSIHADFTVSNAGLRNNQSVVAAVAQAPGPASYDWDTGDILYLFYYYRVLLQKRRV